MKALSEASHVSTFPKVPSSSTQSAPSFLPAYSPEGHESVFPSVSGKKARGVGTFMSGLGKNMDPPWGLSSGRDMESDGTATHCPWRACE